MAGAGANDQLGRFLRNELVERDLVVSEDGHLGALEHQVLVDVPGKRVIVVNEDKVGGGRNQGRRIRMVG